MENMGISPKLAQIPFFIFAVQSVAWKLEFHSLLEKIVKVLHKSAQKYALPKSAQKYAWPSCK